MSNSDTRLPQTAEEQPNPLPAPPLIPAPAAPPPAAPAPTRFEDLVVANEAQAVENAQPAPTEANASPSGPQRSTTAGDAEVPTMTVAQLEAHADTVDDPAEIDRLLDAERAREGGPRTTAIDALESRRAALS